MTPETLARCTGAHMREALLFAPIIDQAMKAYGITTPQRQAAFLAQVGHESGGLLWTTEIWGPTIAQQNYEGRHDLGNTQPGDGSRFRGHGLLQTTGRANHARTRDRLRAKFPTMSVPDFEAEPKRLAEPMWAALSAADYWEDRGLNGLADAGDFMRVTRRINGGVNGYEQRLALFNTAKEVLS